MHVARACFFRPLNSVRNVSRDGRMNSYLVLLASGLETRKRNVIVSSKPASRRPLLSSNLESLCIIMHTTKPASHPIWSNWAAVVRDVSSAGRLWKMGFLFLIRKYPLEQRDCLRGCLPGWENSNYTDAIPLEHTPLFSPPLQPAFSCEESKYLHFC